jgi:uncharacterized protein
MTEQIIKPVTLILRRRVKPGHEYEYENWLTGIQKATNGFTGYMGVNTLRPAEGHKLREYVTLVRFDSYQNLRAWEESDLRRQWSMRLPVDAVEGEIEIERLEGLEFWFQPPANIPTASPSPHKMALIIFVLILFLSLILGSAIRTVFPNLPIYLRTALSAGIQVCLLTYLIMPRITKWLSGWLFKI